jgi:holo-[acyl-carrier protein] synthase
VAAADPYPKFATRFAAKEAFLKALGTGWANGIRWTDVEVTGGGSVAPHLAIHGRAAEILAARGGSASHLSLSHDGEYAFAVCILES